MNVKEFKDLYAAGRVTRYHTSDVPAQSLASHSWGVALIVAIVYPNQKPPARLLLAALTHDLAESVTGDIPAPMKWKSQRLREALREQEAIFEIDKGIAFGLTTKEQAILEWSDFFELCLYLQHQGRMGAVPAQEMLVRAMVRLQSMGPPTTEARELYEQCFGA